MWHCTYMSEEPEEYVLPWGWRWCVVKTLVPIQETTYFSIPINILTSSLEILVLLVKSETRRNLMFLKIMLWIKWKLCALVD